MKRAKDDKDKILRKQDISIAAYQLYIENNYKLPSVIEIAKRARIAKGTIYIYFNSREEIFLGILEAQIHKWFDHIENSIDMTNPCTESIVDSICNFIHSNNNFLPLLSILNTILEKNLDNNITYEFKKRTVRRLKIMSNKIAHKFVNIDEESAAKLLLQGYALIIGLWQVTDFSVKVRKMLNNEGLLILNIDFTSEIKNALTALWKGTLH